MTRLELVLSILLLVSIIINAGVFAYARAAIVRLLWVSEEIGDLKAMISSFSKHVQAVYNTETFYGDQTLQGLVEHARSFDEQLETFEYIYTLTEDIEEPDPDDSTNTEETD
jgi:hypothetical protein